MAVARRQDHAVSWVLCEDYCLWDMNSSTFHGGVRAAEARVPIREYPSGAWRVSTGAVRPIEGTAGVGAAFEYQSAADLPGYLWHGRNNDGYTLLC